MRRKRKILIFLSLVIAIAILLGVAYIFIYHVPSSQQGEMSLMASKHFPTYTALSLAQYNGTNEKLPIYIALDGYVYDVTPGKEFYVPGGAYHTIAGKDASSELRIFGGSIIKEKYKIVGIFSNQ